MTDSKKDKGMGSGATEGGTSYVRGTERRPRTKPRDGHRGKVLGVEMPNSELRGRGGLGTKQ